MQIELYANGGECIFKYTSPCCPRVKDVVSGWNRGDKEPVDYLIQSVRHIVMYDEYGTYNIDSIACIVSVL